jgi:hypothetical protein
MTAPRFRVLVGLLVSIAALSQAEDFPPAEVRLFTGNSPTEGLDLAHEPGGRFTYAINFGSTDTLTIGGLAFQPDSALPDLNLRSNPSIPAWETINNFGSTTADASLATLLHSMRWASHPEDLAFQLTGLETASSHKLQLLFVEKCCQRGFDILVNDNEILQGFSPQQLGGDASGSGVVVSIVLPPGLTEIQIVLRGDARGFPDPSPVIQAATLEQFPTEPATTVALPLLTLKQAPNTNTLVWLSTPGSTYQVEYSETLDQATWLPIGGTLEGTGDTLLSQDSNPARLAKPEGFYRLHVE